MGDTNKRVYGPAQPGVVTGTRYTVPANTRFTMRHIHVSNPTGAAITLTMSIGADAAAVRLFDAFSIAAGAVLDWYPFIQLDAAEIIAANMSSASGVLVIDGTEHTAG